jgi:hypothetical protein
MWTANEQVLERRANTWPLTPVTDPYWSNVGLLLHMNGTNGSTTFTDSGPNAFTITRSGNAQISTAQSKFGGASGLFDGNGDYLAPPDTSSLQPGTGAFTIEFWARWASVSGPQTFFGFAAEFDISKVNAGVIQTPSLMAGGGGLTGTTTFVTDQWYHIAVSRGTGIARLYVDGVEESSQSGTNRNFTSFIWIGREYFNNYAVNGYIDDLRYTVGVNRYAANFTPPTAAFPDA